eukprot:5508784-Pyramimonas_sp.AAC.1
MGLLTREGAAGHQKPRTIIHPFVIAANSSVSSFALLPTALNQAPMCFSAKTRRQPLFAST